MRALGKALLAMTDGVTWSSTDDELLTWVRGEKIASGALKRAYGIHEPATEQNAFNRLKTVVGFLRERLGYRGFLISFDEGSRTASFRRGCAKQKQAIEQERKMYGDVADEEAFKELGILP